MVYRLLLTRQGAPCLAQWVKRSPLPMAFDLRA
jgi:hypothetical protein